MTRDVLAGLGAWILATWMGARTLPDAVDARAIPASPLEAPARTLSPSEPRTLGPRYDDDDALPGAALDVASYDLTVELHPESHELGGKGRIFFTNRTAERIDHLYLHLYLNAFKNTQSRFLRSPFGRSRSGGTTTDFGYIDVRRLALATGTGENLWDGAEPANPDGDETDMHVSLPEPVPPGGRLELEIEWTARLPAIVERTGHASGFHMVAQWFPKLARLEPSGRFAHFEFHPHSEFYSDFGTYDVRIDVPESLIIGATGKLVGSEVRGERRVDHYRAENVHDFAFAAWDAFRVLESQVGGIQVRILHPPGHDTNARITLQALTRGLSQFGELFGAYPYETLTVVHPPAAAQAAGGMEYPTLITTGGPWYAGSLSTFIERVTLHELGHQWFYGMVATDERSFPFLDEGLTSYAEGLAMEALFGGASGLRLGSLQVSGRAYLRGLAASAAHRDLVARPADAFASFGDLSALVYARTATLLDTLAGVWGQDAVNQALGRYARRYRYEHPGPRHLVSAIREVLGDEAARVLSRGLFEGGWVDFVARDLRSAPVRTAAGIFDEGNGRITKEPEKKGTGVHQSRVLVYRHGTLELPVEVDLELADGSVVRKSWSGRGRFATITHEAPQPVVAARVDPDLKIPLDQNLLNNAVSTRKGRAPRTLERITYGTQLALGLFGP